MHHRIGMHFYNFSDLPLWHIVFGTFGNPKQDLGGCGFGRGGDWRLGAMLAFEDVNEAPNGPRRQGVNPALREAKPAVAT